GFRRAGVVLSNCSGEPEREVRLERVAVSGSGTGVRIVGGPTRHVRIDWCRFDAPLADGVAVTGPTDAVGVSFCRFHDVANGVHVEPGAGARGGEVAENIRLTNNAFADLRYAGLAVGERPEPGSHFVVMNNLFFRVPK